LPHFSHLLIIGILAAVISTSVQARESCIVDHCHHGANLDLNQVQAGWAAVYPKYCADPVYYQAQEDARAHGRGIWRVEGEQQQPWAWRHKSR